MTCVGEAKTDLMYDDTLSSYMRLKSFFLCGHIVIHNVVI